MTARDDLAVAALAKALVRTGMYVDAGIDTSAGLDKPQVYATAILNDPDLAADGLHFVMIETLDRDTLDAARAAAPPVEPHSHPCEECDIDMTIDYWTKRALASPDPVAGLREAREWLDWWDAGGYATDAAIEAVDHLRNALLDSPKPDGPDEWRDHIPSGYEDMTGYGGVSCSCGWDSSDVLGWEQHINAASIR